MATRDDLAEPGAIGSRWDRLRHELRVGIWSPQARSRGATVLVIAARSLVAIQRSFLGGQRNLQAGLLTYTTLVTLVPFLAVFFAFFAAFAGVEQIDRQARALVFRYLTPSTAGQVSETLSEVLGRLRLAPIGGIGLLLLMAAVLTLLAQVEAAFNHIWEAPRGRPWGRRLPLYWSVATLTPLFLAAGLGLAAYVPEATRLVPLVFGSLGFAAAYKLLPNRRVHIRWALLGAVIAATLFELIARWFAWYTTEVVDYHEIYGSVAAIPLFLVWLFTMWHVVLAGAEVARANQDPRRYAREHTVRPGSPVAVALAVAIGCARRFGPPAQPLELDALADELLLPERDIDDVACRLDAAGLLTAFGDYPERYYLLAAPPERTRVRDILAAALGESPPISARAFTAETLAELA